MKTTIQKMTIRTLLEKNGQINFDPPFQRKSGLWSAEKRKALIYSVLKGYDMPKIYITLKDELIDGKQRLTTLIDYAMGKFKTDKSLLNLDNMDFKKLPPSVQQQFLDYSVDVAYVDGTDNEVRELFLLHQNGVTLNAGEVRNAIGGWLRDQMNELARLPFFNFVTFNNKRFAYMSTCAKCFTLMHSGTITEVSSGPLRSLYKMYRLHNPLAHQALESTRDVLIQMGDIFAPNSDKIITLSQMICLDYFWLIHQTNYIYGTDKFWLFAVDIDQRMKQYKKSINVDPVMAQLFKHSRTHTENIASIYERNRVLFNEYQQWCV